jgi:iron complex outermembrane recepter protein
LFVNNVANIHANLGNVIFYSENLPTFNRVATNQPRTIGLDLSYKF